ncbi:SERTA domain-containing protein 2b [Corythoichthys intestinalis]|uniref:SERTA domain-containing protein 2b n=1 Tax=Corythoichthys intestinalis TaxID=161448 RepID=UPI0025A6794A|nr:SERTA domain-containing protein 2b [Corythoichthys intestinalis]XP_061793918.1 SERTA domain-containing protein 2-like [Nerophis lumbriciformis]
MFSKGAKRKLDEYEEVLEGKTLEASEAGGGLGLGHEGLSKVSYTLQRQTIFNISLMKLYSQRPLNEPSLERRVLINNMLRRIQEELKQEGSLRPLLLPPSPPPDDPMDEGFREAPPSFGVLSAAVTAQAAPPSALLMPAIIPPPSPHPSAPPDCPPPPDACLTPASLLEEDGADSSFCASSPPTPPLSPPPLQSQTSINVSSSNSVNGMDLRPLTAISRTAAAISMTVTTSLAPTLLTQHPHLAALSPAPSGPAKDCRSSDSKTEAICVSLVESSAAEHRPMDAHPAAPPSAPVEIYTSHSPASAPSGFLTDLALDDVLFADIDTSMYDFDPCVTAGAVGTPASAGLAKISPVVTADDVLKSLASPYSGPAPQVSANQPFKIDLTELDHIMEVLVGS